MNFMMTTCEFNALAKLSDLDIAAMYISAAIHDFEHPFQNFLKKINKKIFLNF